MSPDHQVNKKERPIQSTELHSRQHHQKSLLVAETSQSNHLRALHLILVQSENQYKGNNKRREMSVQTESITKETESRVIK